MNCICNLHISWEGLTVENSRIYSVSRQKVETTIHRMSTFSLSLWEAVRNSPVKWYQYYSMLFFQTAFGEITVFSRIYQRKLALIKIAFGNSFAKTAPLLKDLGHVAMWEFPSYSFFPLCAKHDPMAPSFGSLTMTLFSSWMTFNDLILLSFQQHIWISPVIPRALFLLQMELPALNDHFNIWVWLLLGHLWLNHRNLKCCSHRWPHLNALNKKVNAPRLMRMRLDSFCKIEVIPWIQTAK